MSDFTPPETVTVKAKENGKLDYAQVNSRFIGLMFEYNDYQYLYRYPDGFNEKEGGEIVLFEKRISKTRSDIELGMTDKEFRIVEVIKIHEGYVFCTLIRLWISDVSSWVSNDLQHVAMKLYKLVETMREQNDMDDDRESILGHFYLD